MLINVYIVTPISIYYMLTVPTGTYRPFPPLWDFEPDTPPMTSPVWWLVIHSLVASVLVDLWAVFFLHPSPYRWITAAIGLANYAFVLLIFINPFRFSDLPWPMAFVINVGCASAMLWFIPEKFRFSSLVESLPIIGPIAKVHKRYPGQIDVYLTTLGLPILYFYLKAFFFLTDTILERALVILVGSILQQLHRPPQGQPHVY